MHNHHNTGNKDTRSGFGIGLHELGQENDQVVALCADLTGSLKMNAFADDFPDRFFQVGIAEAHMMSMAAGLTIGGKIPFTGTFANFSTGRVYDHIGLMKMLPSMTVIVPCDHNQTKAATKAIADFDGPVYLRFGRPKVPNFTPADTPFQIGVADVLTTGSDVTIAACGHLVWEALEAANVLEAEGISAEVINFSTIKPLDKKALLASVGKTGRLVTAEEHQRNGGLGDSLAQLLALEMPSPVEMVAVNDSFGESGTPAQLMEKYGLDTKSIIASVHRVMAR